MDMKLQREYTCCFTGHRPAKLAWGYDESDERCKRLKAVLQQEIERCIGEGVRTFVTGMAQGTDIWAAEIVLAKKAEQPDVRLIAAIPHEGQERSWSEDYKKRYAAIRAAADDEVVFFEHYTRSCMHVRNRYMVDNSLYLIAVFNGEKGGTKGTIDYAVKKGLKVVIINPDDMTVRSEV